MVGVQSFKQLYARLAIYAPADDPVQYMVRLQFGSFRGSTLDGHTLLACTLQSDQAVDGIWSLPKLDLSEDMAVETRAGGALPYAADRPPIGAVTLNDCRLKLTVTAFRASDGKLLRMLKGEEYSWPGDCPEGWEVEDPDKKFWVVPVE